MTTTLIQSSSTDFVFEHEHRGVGLVRYRVPFGAYVMSRAGGAVPARTRSVIAVQLRDGGHESAPEEHEVVLRGPLQAPPKTRSLLSSFVRDYELGAYAEPAEATPQDAPPPVDGERPQPSGAEQQAPAVAEESTPPTLADRGPRSAASSAPEVALASLSFDGDALELARLPGDGPDDGWVSLPSLLAPFGKRSDNVAGLLEGWGRTRVEFVAPFQEGSNGDRRAKATTLLHFRDAPLFVARLDQRGMDEGTKKKHARYLRECADVLARHFLGPPTASPAPSLSREEVAQIAARAAIAAVREMGLAPAPHAPALPPVPPGGTASLGDGLTLHAAPQDGISARTAARRVGLPSTGCGRQAVSILADLEGVWENPALHRKGTWLGGTGRTNEHRLFTDAGIDKVRPRARRYVEALRRFGWYVTGGDGRLASVTAPPVKTAELAHKRALAVASAPAETSQMGFDA